MSTDANGSGRSSAPLTLWRDEAGGRFFLVPDDAELPHGPLLLRAGLKDVGGVDPDSAAPYEVTREEARAFLDARLDRFVASTKASVGGFFSALGIDTETDAGESSSSTKSAEPSPSPVSPEAEIHAEPADDASGNADDNPGVRLFSALTGQPPEAVTSDPAAFLDGLASLLRGAGETLSRAASASGGEEGRAEFESKLEALRQTLREHGIHPPDEPAPPAEPVRSAE